MIRELGQREEIAPTMEELIDLAKYMMQRPGRCKVIYSDIPESQAPIGIAFNDSESAIFIGNCIYIRHVANPSGTQTIEAIRFNEPLGIDFSGLDA